jgi:hypothetical protein
MQQHLRIVDRSHVQRSCLIRSHAFFNEQVSAPLDVGIGADGAEVWVKVRRRIDLALLRLRLERT